MTELVQNFRFTVTLTRSDPGEGPTQLGDGAFAECSGLQLEADIREHLEGGRNDGVVRRVGRVKLVPLVLKRGMFALDPEQPADSSLWNWLTGMVAGTLPIPRYDGEIELHDATGGRVLATWASTKGYRQRWSARP
jgi:phage tail-like protein